MSNSVLDPVAQENPTRFNHPTCVFLRDYWESKRCFHAMPSRAEQADGAAEAESWLNSSLEKLGAVR
jgi:hypothetical protein